MIKISNETSKFEYLQFFKNLLVSFIPVIKIYKFDYGIMLGATAFFSISESELIKIKSNSELFFLIFDLLWSQI